MVKVLMFGHALREAVEDPEIEISLEQSVFASPITGNVSRALSRNYAVSAIAGTHVYH